MTWLVAVLLAAGAVSPELNGGLGKLLFPTLKSAEIKAEILGQQSGYEGAGAEELKAAIAAASARDEKLTTAHAAFKQLDAAMGEVDDAQDDAAKQALRERLEALSKEPLDAARAQLKEAIELERQRVALIKTARQKALADAAQLPGVDKKQLERMTQEAGSDKLPVIVDGRIDAYRHMALGLIDYLNADYKAAVAKMRTATEVAPDLAQAYVYLGSFAYITRKRSVAIRAWQRALELRPDDAELRRALEAITD